MQDTTTTTIQPLVEYFNRLMLLREEEKDLVTVKFHPHLFSKRLCNTENVQETREKLRKAI